MMDDFDRFLIFLNPASTGIAQSKRRINEFESLIPKNRLEIIELSGTGRTPTSDTLIAKSTQLGPRTLIGIAAGDGTTSVIVDTLVRDKRLSSKARQTSVLPLWGGNANDLANMLNGPASHANLKNILKNAKTISVYPLHFDLHKSNGDSETRIAVCNASFGATAYVALRLNDGRFRRSKLHKIPGGRLIKEAATAVSSLIQAPTFEAEDAGIKKILYERTFSNGSRIAKIYQVPIELNDKRFFLNTIEQKRFMITALMLSASFRTRGTEDSLRESLTFKVLEDTQAQFDGETTLVSAGTTIYARISDQPFYALSTQLTEII